MFLDGGTILIETNLGDYSFDHRIGTTTPNAMYYGMPADDNENLLSEERVLEIKPQILEALKGYYKEFYQPTIDKFIAENS